MQTMSEEDSFDPELTSSHSYFKRIRFGYLISGYCRQSINGCFSTLPETAQDLILGYFPQFNGTTFKWTINQNDYIINEIINLTQPTSSSSQNQLSFTSDGFGVGFPSNFFLRLRPNAHSKITTTPPSSDGKCVDPRFGQSLVAPGVINQNGQESQQKRDIKSSKFVLELESLPIESKYQFILFHCELYFGCVDNHNTHLIQSSHSIIWGMNDSVRVFQWVIGKSSDIIDLLISQGQTMYSNNKIEIECKIKILKVLRPYLFGVHNDDINYYFNFADLYEEHRQTRALAIFNNDESQNLDVYGNKQPQKYTFEWRLTSLFQNRVCDFDMTNMFENEQFHSGIFYDIFQLQYDSKNGFGIMICGLPFRTHRMGVKCDLFVGYKNLHNNYNSDYGHNTLEQVLSEMIMFDYILLTKHYFSKNATDKIRKYWQKYQNITLICEINVIQRYDGYNKVLNALNNIDTQEDTSVMTQQDKEFPMVEEEELKLASTKEIVQVPTEIFVWRINDEKILLDIKKNENASQAEYFSNVFSFLNRRWYLIIETCKIIGFDENDENNTIGSKRKRSKKDRGKIVIRLRRMDSCWKLTDVEYPFFDVTIDIIETKGHFHVRYDSRKYSSCSLRIPIKAIQKLVKKQLTIRAKVLLLGTQPSLGKPTKVSIEPIVRVVEEKNQKEFKKCDNKEQFEKWLIDTVKLPQYAKNFEKHNLMNLNIVEKLNEENLIEIGICKVGDKLRLLEHIDMLKKGNVKSIS